MSILIFIIAALLVLTIYVLDNPETYMNRYMKYKIMQDSHTGYWYALVPAMKFLNFTVVFRYPVDNKLANVYGRNYVKLFNSKEALVRALENSYNSYKDFYPDKNDIKQ